jgi:hypothetical protein
VLRCGLTRSAVDDVRYIVGTYDKDAGPNNQRLYLNGARVAQISDTLPIDLNSTALGIGRHRRAGRRQWRAATAGRRRCGLMG